MRRVLISLVVGTGLTATPFFLSAAGLYSDKLNFIGWPGLRFARALFAEGVHAGLPFVVLALASNVAFYAAAAWGILALTKQLAHGDSRKP